MVRNRYIVVLAVVWMATSTALFAAGKAGGKTFEGKVINIAADYIELKMGKKEMTFPLTDTAKYLSREGKEQDKSILEVCQVVKVFYTIEKGKKKLEKIQIVKESDCVN